MPKFRKKPIVIEARQFFGAWENAQPILVWMESDWRPLDLSSPRWSDLPDRGPQMHIPTPEGELTASPGDWIIKGVKGEFYSCKPDIFVATYEEVGDA